MLHLIRIIMFVVHEQLPQSLLSTHFQKLFCLICISSSSFFSLAKFFFFVVLFFSLWLKNFPLFLPTHSLLIQAVYWRLSFFPHCCFVFWDMQICLPPVPLYFKQHFKQKLWDLNYANHHHQTPELQGVTHAITPSNPLPTKTPLHFYCEHQQHTMTCMWTPNLWQNDYAFTW